MYSSFIMTYLVFRLLPWLQLDGNVLFLSQASDIGAYHLSQDSGRVQRKPFEIYSGHKGDVCHFALTDSHLISGGRLVNALFVLLVTLFGVHHMR